MDEFDYTGTGGFLIECQKGDILGVTKEQAIQVEEECVFFSNCFRHGTIESHHGVLRKPDWSLAVARHLIELLTKGKTTIPTLELYTQLMEAADQALIDVRICSLVNYFEPTPYQKHHFLDLVQPQYYQFKLRANVTSKQWHKLLEQDILLYRRDTNFVVKVCKQNVLDCEKTRELRRLDQQVSEYLVHAERSIEALLTITKTLRKRNDKRICRQSTKEHYEIYYETMETFPDDHHDRIARLAGGEKSYIRTCAGDCSGYRTEGYTVTGDFDVLRLALCDLQNKDVPCSLRLHNPSPDILQRFIVACKQAPKYPGTLGFDSSHSSNGFYFCKKTVSDIYFILVRMADYSLNSCIKDDFLLSELSSEGSPF